MKIFKSRFILVAIFVLILSGLGVYFYPKEKKPDQSIRDNSDLSDLIKKSSEIQRQWWEGEDSEAWGEIKEQCLSFYGINEKFDESLIRCNPMLLKCMNLFSKKWKGSFDENISLISALKEKDGGYFVRILGKNNLYLNVLLKNNCHEVFLEEKNYAYGEEPKPNEGDDFIFDNFNQKIYLDKHLVTNWEYKEYLNSQSPVNNFKAANNELFLPVTNITLTDMNNYCIFHGKELMNAHFFDAATFLWETNNLGQKILKRSPFYWTKNKKEKIQSCSQVFTKECFNSQKYILNSISPSWSGIMDSQGGVMEAYKNPIEPNKNLRVSSFYLERNSKWHYLGKRANWTGEGSERRYFNLKDAEIDVGQTTFKVGFRCMRRVFK